MMLVLVPQPGQTAAGGSSFTLNVTPTKLDLLSGQPQEVALVAVRKSPMKASTKFQAISDTRGVVAAVRPTGANSAIALVSVAPDVPSSSATLTILATSGSVSRRTTIQITVRAATTTVQAPVPTVATVTTTVLPPPETSRGFLMDAAFKFPYVGPTGTAIAIVTLDVGAEAAAVELMPSPRVTSWRQTGRDGRNVTFEVTFGELEDQALTVGFTAKLGSAVAEAWAPINLTAKPFITLDSSIVVQASYTGERRIPLILTEISGIARPEYRFEGFLQGLTLEVHKGACTSGTYPTTCTETIVLNVVRPFEYSVEQAVTLVATTPRGTFRYRTIFQIKGYRR